MKDFLRGAEWRKWDLHAHTAIDTDWEEKPYLSSEEAKRQFARDYIKCAVEQGLSAIAITDHNFCNDLDNCLIPYIKKEALKNNIVIFPGFEITAHEGSGVHLLVIFPENADLRLICKIVEQCFDVGTKLLCKPIPASNMTISQIKTTIDRAGLDSLFIFAHADGSSGVLNEKTIKGQKRINTWHSKEVQISQILKPDAIKFPQENPDYRREMTYIIASDCRRITKTGLSDRNCLGDKFTWIKADLTFEGLKQIIREPNERVYIGEEPPKLRDITLNKTKYIDEVEIYSENTNNEWFNEKMKLNSELISIIGNKGSGKSAFADIIGLLGNSHNYKDFSFLNKDKF